MSSCIRNVAFSVLSLLLGACNQCFKCHIVRTLCFYFFSVYTHYVKIRNDEKINLECYAFKTQWSVDYWIRWQSIVFVTQWRCSYAKEIQHRLTLLDEALITVFWTHEKKVMVRKFRKLKKEYLIPIEFHHKIEKWNRGGSTQSEFPSGSFVSQVRKSFTNGELTRLCWIAAGTELCLEKINLFKTISLLAWTVARRVEDIINQLKNKANDFEWFSLALDELVDITNTAQLLFI